MASLMSRSRNAQARSRRPGAVLVRASDLGGHDDPGPRDLAPPDRLMRLARLPLLPVTSLMRVQTTDAVMALTYDDGPHPVHTREVMDVLAQRDVRATFFVLAKAAQQNPTMITDLLAAGHEIGLHGWDHANLSQVSPRAAVTAIRSSAAALEQIAGRRITMYRPTYGRQGWPQYLAARALGLDVVYWTAWAQDWLDEDAPSLASRALYASHPGGVLLLHDATGDADTSGLGEPAFSRGELTARVVDGLHAQGYTVLTAGELFGRYLAVRAVTLRPPSFSHRRH